MYTWSIPKLLVAVLLVGVALSPIEYMGSTKRKGGRALRSNDAAGVPPFVLGALCLKTQTIVSRSPNPFARIKVTK